jgi:hypothetical protein
MTTINSQAYETGYEAFRQGEDRDANHYAAGTWEAKEWARGWDEAAAE